MGSIPNQGMKIKLLVLEENPAMFLKILTCCALLLVQVVYNIAGANGGNYPVPPPETLIQLSFASS